MHHFSVVVDGWWWGIVTYLPAHLLHVVVWRLKPRLASVPSLLLCTIAMPLALMGISAALGVSLPWPVPLVHLLVAVNYVAIYPAFQASSPTVHLLSLLAKRPQGLTEGEVMNALLKKTAIEDRLSDL